MIKKIKYADSEVGSCIDISANYGYNKDDKKVIMDTLKPYRLICIIIGEIIITE